MSNEIHDANVIDRFHHAREGKSESWLGGGPMKARGNVTFSQLMDVLENLWEKKHRELKFVPLGSREKFDSEIGYIVYSLENKKPSENNLKPRFREDIIHTDSGDKEGAVYTQTFDHLIQFTAVHRDPKDAEAIIEAFEDFMMVIGPEMIMIGVEKFFYSRRVSDRDETRYGEDVATRGVQFLVQLQKMILVEVPTLKGVRLDVRLSLQKSAPNSYSIMYMDIPYESAD